MPAASDKEKAIHKLILQRDDLAFAKLCDDYFEPVLKRINTFNKHIARENETLLMDLVTDAFMNYFKDPHKYDPQKSGLEAFLVMDIEGDLLNALAKIKRQNKKLRIPVELNEENGNSLLKDHSMNAIDSIIERETAALLERHLNALFSSDKDKELAHLMLAGERRSSEYVRLLELENIDKAAQESEIKRQKDRVDKTIRRKLRK